MERKFIPFSANVNEDDVKLGIVRGIAAAYSIDQKKDIIMPGAFLSSILELKSRSMNNRPSNIKFLYQHDPTTPLGVVTDLQEVDGVGLTAELKISNTDLGRNIKTLISDRALDGLSIGYKVRDSVMEDGIRYLKDIDLREISVVTFPMNEDATIEYIMSNDEKLEIKDSLPPVSELLEPIKEEVKEESFSGELDFKSFLEGCSLLLEIKKGAKISSRHRQFIEEAIKQLTEVIKACDPEKEKAITEITVELEDEEEEDDEEEDPGSSSPSSKFENSELEVPEESTELQMVLEALSSLKNKFYSLNLENK